MKTLLGKGGRKSDRSIPGLGSFGVSSGKKSGTTVYVVTGLAVALVTLSWFGHTDVYAVANARVQPVGRSKPIQVSDAGNIEGFYVRDGQLVRRGQILFTMDNATSKADYEAAVSRVASLNADIVRRASEIIVARAKPSKFLELKPGFDASVPKYIAERQVSLWLSDMMELQSNLRENAAKTGSTRADLAEGIANVAGGSEVARTLGERFAIKSSLRKDGWVSETDVIDAREQLERQNLQNSQYRASIAESSANINTLNTQYSELITKFISDNENAIKEDYDKVAEAIADRAKTNAKLGRTVVKAPIDGYVQQVSIETPGQFVNAGQQVLTIVPEAPILTIEALVLDRDIGFVHEGQSAVIKIDSFPYTKYGTLKGIVTSLSRDSIESKEMGELNDDEVSRGSATSSAAVQSTKGLVYPVEITLSGDHFSEGNRRLPIQPGMSGTAEIVTSRRRIIEYILSPVTSTVEDAGHER